MIFGSKVALILVFNWLNIREWLIKNISVPTLKCKVLDIQKLTVINV